MARPRKKIDPEQVRKLAAIDCSYAEMAAVLDCDESTLTRRFAQAIKRGREQGCVSLKRRQFRLAQKGNVAMLIWLGKQRLNQADKHEEKSEVNKTIRVVFEDIGANDMIGVSIPTVANEIADRAD